MQRNTPSLLAFPTHESTQLPCHAASSPAPDLSHPSLVHAPDVSFSLSPTPAKQTKSNNGALEAVSACNLHKYERYNRPGKHPLAYLLYYILTVSPACA